jgi:hypothetical protein
MIMKSITPTILQIELHMPEWITSSLVNITFAKKEEHSRVLQEQSQCSILRQLMLVLYPSLFSPRNWGWVDTALGENSWNGKII